VKRLDAQLAQVVVAMLEVGRQSTNAAHALLEGDSLEIAFEVVGPVVIHAGEALAVAFLVDA